MTRVRQGSRREIWAIAVFALVATTCSSLGDPCRSNSECHGDLVCLMLEADGGKSTAGVCTHAFAGLGGHCRLAADCGPALLCSNELPSEVKRRDGTCVALRETAETCAKDDQCRTPAICLLISDGNGTCETMPQEAGTD